MADIYAQDLYEIPEVLSHNGDLREAVIALVESQPIAGKATEGGDRVNRFRAILIDLFNGDTNFTEAYHRTERELPRHSSIHRDSNRVFASGWAERLVLTQYSRFYNQAVMEKLINEGYTECYVPHSPGEDVSSPCSQQLAGGNHSLQTLYTRLIESYERGQWTRKAKIPDHPHCTHVVTPPQLAE